MGTQKNKLYIDVRDEMADDRINFLFIISPRGAGKTYTGLQWAKERGNFLYIRNQADEADLCCTAKGNPFKKLNHDFGWDIQFEVNKKLYDIADYTSGERVDIGTGIALSTSAKMKGFDMFDVESFVYEEFIPEQGVRMMVNEGEAFARLYETVARNREIEGRAPLKAVLLSNATQINSRVLSTFRIEDVVERMIIYGQRKVTIPERGIKVFMPEVKQLTELKAQTALYKAIGRDSGYARHALNNEFTMMSLQFVKKRKLAEYTPMCAYDDLYIYRHKSRPEFYVSRSSASVERYTSMDTDSLFKRRFYPYKDLMINGTFIYESYQVKREFLDIFKL